MAKIYIAINVMINQPLPLQLINLNVDFGLFVNSVIRVDIITII
jgi:hypothetical protein